MLEPLSIAGVFLLGASAGALVTYAKQRHLIKECRKAIFTYDSAISGPVTEEVGENIESGSRFAMKALVVARDLQIALIFARLFRELRVEAVACPSEREASTHLASEKFAAIVFDVKDFPNCSAILKDVPGPNKRALVIAVTDESNAKRAISNISAGLIIQRPLVLSQIRTLLHGVYGRMLRDEQAYFRLPIEISVWLRKESGKLLDCTTLNLSQRGMAVGSSAFFEVGEDVSIGFSLPNTDILVSAKGTIIWDDKHGKAGISFECTNTSVQERYFEWLQDHFFRYLESQAQVDTVERPSPDVASSRVVCE